MAMPSGQESISLISSDAAEDARVNQTLALIDTLISSLPPKEVEQLVRLQIAKHKIGATTRSGKILGTILKLLPQKERWTVAEIKRHIGDEGVEAEQKQIFNAMQYLKKTGRVRRVGYGQYLVDGVLLQTSDEHGLPNARHEDAYRTDDVSNE